MYQQHVYGVVIKWFMYQEYVYGVASVVLWLYTSYKLCVVIYLSAKIYFIGDGMG